MQKTKLDVLIAMFAYAGNGGVATVLPEIAVWLANNAKKITADERVGRLAVKKYGDIPLTMERNRVVKDAKDGGFDVIIMLDSDNIPDLYLNHRDSAQPFWDTSFDFLYERTCRGIPTVVCAPYCGPPPHPVGGGEENVYVFYAAGTESDDTDSDVTGAVKFEAYSREHSSLMKGIQSCAAGPTGCIMYSTDAFDLMPIGEKSKEQILSDYSNGLVSLERTKQLLSMESWFFYEFTDQYQTNKASTEDVTNTREINFAGLEKFMEPVLFCNWDAWAGHMKPKCVGAPATLRIEQVSGIFAEAVRNNISSNEQIVNVDFTKNDRFDAPKQQDLFVNEVEEKMFANSRPCPPKSGGFRKELRFGKPFKNPVFSQEDLNQVRELVWSAFRSVRTLVIGDRSGELAYATNWNKGCDTFALAVGDEWDEYGACPEIKRIGQKDPIEAAGLLIPQELDGVVISGETYDAAAVADVWLSNHVKKGGFAVIVRTDPSMDMTALGEYDIREMEGTQVVVIIKEGVDKDVAAAV